MSVEVIVIMVVGVLLILLIAALLLGLPIFGLNKSTPETSQMSRMVESQRQTMQTGTNTNAGLRGASANKTTVRPPSAGGSKLTLEKKLRYAQWSLPALHFRIIEIVISVIITFLVSLKFNLILTAVALTSGPVFMRWLLDKFVNKRFKAFDDDYPGFLMNLVSLLKTGMNVTGAMEAAAKTLDSESLLRLEVELMLERLKYGVAEERSIGSFGEDILHEEIELFVQALLMSRRMGGTLSDTLDRLAKQVRKRQYFRASAISAVAMQRGSVGFILCIMFALEAYIYFTYPASITTALADPIGWEVWQFGFLVIIGGIYWIGQVTKIRV